MADAKLVDALERLERLEKAACEERLKQLQNTVKGMLARCVQERTPVLGRQSSGKPPARDSRRCCTSAATASGTRVE